MIESIRRGSGGVFLPQRDDAVLDGDEVAVAEISGGAVAARPVVVVRVQLDEALPALAQQRERQQAHLDLQLALDVGDERRPAFVVHRRRRRWRPRAGRAGGPVSFLFAEQSDFGAQRGIPDLAVGTLPGGEIVAEPGEKDGEDDDAELVMFGAWTYGLQVRQLNHSTQAELSALRTPNGLAFFAWN